MERRLLDPKRDVVFKMLLGRPESREVLMALLTAVLRPSQPIVDVEVLNPEMPKEGVLEKGAVVDLRLRLPDGTLLDVEMQSAKLLSFFGRALFCWARMFHSQLLRGSNHGTLRPVISVLFLNHVALPGPRFHSVFKVLEVHDHSEFSGMLEIHTVELPKLARLSAQEQAPQGCLGRVGAVFVGGQ